MDIATKTQRECEERVAEEYLSSLSDLNCNSKPLINMLTMLAEENIEYAPVIVKVVEQHIAKVPPEFKLPILYLIDSIVKNVKGTYVQLFSQCIVTLFCGVFEKVNEKIRERMYALRQTWNEVFSAQKLYALDVKVKKLDNNWPITAKQPSIHVNPIFLKTATQAIPTEMEKILQDKTRELLELKKRKLELELEATKKHLEEQEKQFSKTAEGVLPPVDALVVASALQTVGMRAPNAATMAGQVMPGMAAGYMGGQNVAINPLRPPMYHQQNVRSFRPNLHHPGMLNEQVQQVIPPGMVNKPRVHPVNSALISSVRQRDPRLLRQQQQQQQQQQHHQQTTSASVPTSTTTSQMSSSHATADHSDSLAKQTNRNERSHKGSRSKSPTRSSSSTSVAGGSRSSSSRSSKSSSRDKERDRKRSDSKGSSSSSTFSSNAERKKSSASSYSSSSYSKSDSKQSTKCDKDAFEIAPLSSAFKRKSSSPSSSPSKSRDSKRSNKSSRSGRSKTSSRSPSPESAAESYKDSGTHSRRMSTTSSSSSMMASSPEKQRLPKITDNEAAAAADSGAEDTKSKLVDTTAAAAAGAAAASSSANITDKKKSTEKLLSDDHSSSSASPPLEKHEKVTDMDTTTAANSQLVDDHVSKDQHHHDEDAKKRPLAPIKDEEEPLAKKSKPTKLDNLFGSEDVDLRQLMPPISGSATEETAPPPPSFKVSANEPNENWDNVKTDATSKQTSSNKKSSLDDVRAKLAKTAKLNKMLKLDKSNRDLDQRNKLAELQMNEDTQEANDEKIRTMIAQAQELLESKSINQDQYKNLVKTVMSINEDNKLKEAKRRESLNTFKDKINVNNSNNDDGASNDSERNAARDAVLRKRIPKINKAAATISNELSNSESPQSTGESGGNVVDEPMRNIDDKHNTDSNEEQNIRGNNRRDKRGKISKWGDRVVEPPPNNMMPGGPMPGGPMQQQRPPWNNMMPQNKRGGPPGGVGPMGFRPNMPPNSRPPWPMGGGNNMPPHFGKGGPGPMGGGPMRGGMPPMGGGPPPPPAIAPPMIPKPCNSIDNPQEDIVRTITIDGCAKEIRFYDDIAIVFMEVDQPREIGFQNGQRTIYIDNYEPITLQFNHDYKPVTLDGETFNLRFGSPSRELFIDEHWYEIYFGGPPITVPIRNKLHMLKAEGPPPQVNIGSLRRDLVVGKINMIVDAHNVIPLFLDARIQTFRLGDVEHTVQFADNLLTVLLDGAPTRVEYGGLPKSLYLGANKYFIRFGALPQGVVAGKVHIKDMIYVETKPPVSSELTAATNTNPLTTEAALNQQAELQKPTEPTVPILPAAALSNLNIDELFQKLVSTGILGGASGILPAVNTNNTATPAATTTTATNNPTADPKTSSTATTTKAATPETEEATPAQPPAETIKPIELSKPESIKTRQAAIVNTLFSGMQCSSCGVRFPPEQTIKYSQHLDWHFRQNRRDRDSSRKAHSRKWYYDLNDWIQYEEIEDLDEREKNFFETPQGDLEIMDETSNQRSTNSPIQSCPAGTDDVDRACDMCQEKFEQFYNEELEEWHLRCAIRVEDKTYHPLCYEDYKASLNPPAVPKEMDTNEDDVNEEPSLIQIDDDNAVDIVIKVEEDDSKEKDPSLSKAEDEDDDVIVLPNEEPSVTEIDDDDDEYVPANVTREQMGNIHEDDDGDLNETTESDVEIQEPHIPFTDLDTYEEKELPELGKEAFMNIKIKEEPNADEDEDDGFEDVGTVLIAPEEISIHSSEETQTQTIESSTSAMSPGQQERPASTPSVVNEENETTSDNPPATDLNISMDGNIDAGDEHNLSAVGLAPTMPLASLVNKIKINITKNNVNPNSTGGSSNSSASSAAKHNLGGDQTRGNLGTAGGAATSSSTSSFNHIPTISTIPVLCGGGTTICTQTIAPNLVAGGSMYEEHSNPIASLGSGGIAAASDNSVSTISVIGSIYGNNGPTATVSRTIPQANVIVPAKPPATTPTPPPVEETITYELKPALQKANLRKKEKVICGNETSGLCSIM
ncbi:pcf11 cleavage and polyadenylation factor subunit isoform X2 [Musca autumnalis]|uniref:pcf11 cleavage and polyadenylation factor subunit isoform X2 n=1 Tax=Musca autumnalis TaxID=221902 RepID=UPI003CF3BEE7